MNRGLVIFGSAEIAQLARFYFENDTGYRVAAFTVDDDFVQGDTFENIPLVPFSEITQRFPPAQYDMHVALSYARLNRLRQEKYQQAKNAAYSLASYVSTRAVTWPALVVGDNCFILENQTIQPGVRIGNNVMIWSGNHLGHGSSIGDHTYVSSHVVISGNCVIGERNFFGVNSTVRDFCSIGNDCFIGMSAVVAKNMPDGAVALSPSADVYDAGDRRAKALKRSYFKI
jgi:sugar O-acyltransferase (sialic acid O-acetyltransferase NeuD family)